MNITDLRKISRNKYLIPIIIGLAIVLVGIIINVKIFLDSKKETTEETTEQKEKAVEPERKSLKSLLFGSEKYDLKYTDINPSAIENIGFFEANEHWQGNGGFDNRIFYEGDLLYS